MSEPIFKYEEEEIARVKLDFDELADWRNAENDDIPICSCFSLYEASGLKGAIQKYCEENKAQIVAADNLVCNFYTLQRIKNFITENWQTYSIDIKEDNKVFWDTKRWNKNQKHYAKTLRAKVRNSVNADFVNFCPGIDDELEDNLIVFKIYHKIEVPAEEVPEKEE